jgi:hypothetical protein
MKDEYQECVSLISAYLEWLSHFPDSNAQGAFNRAKWAVEKLAEYFGIEVVCKTKQGD